MGKHRIYYAPENVDVDKNKNNISKKARSFFGFSSNEIDNALSQTYDFIADGVQSVTTTSKADDSVLSKDANPDQPSSNNQNLLNNNSEV
jgi:hypothetical protein